MSASKYNLHEHNTQPLTSAIHHLICHRVSQRMKRPPQRHCGHLTHFNLPAAMLCTGAVALRLHVAACLRIRRLVLAGLIACGLEQSLSKTVGRPAKTVSSWLNTALHQTSRVHKMVGRCQGRSSSNCEPFAHLAQM